ncbi:MAG: hypothetical protein ABI266_02245 [Ginsengibacter sp.]
MPATIKFNTRSNILIIGLIACMHSCERPTSVNKIADKTEIVIEQEAVKPFKTDSEIVNQLIPNTPDNVDLQATAFIENLKNGKKLSSFFNDKWLLIYHEDNRCTGSTDGQINNLSSLQIDSELLLKVKNDGDGWACEKQEPKTYDFNFYLKKQISKWDRFVIPNYEKKENNIVYVLGAGESDFLILHYNENKKIIKLEYRSEDPG